MESMLICYVCILTLLLVQSAVAIPLRKKLVSQSAKRAPSPSSPQGSLSKQGQAAHLHRTLENSLLNDTNAMYELQQLFFPPDNHLSVAKIPFDVTITVENVTNPDATPSSQSPFNCTRSEGSCSWSNVHIDWYPEVTAAEFNDDLRQYVLPVYTELRELEYVSWWLLQLLAEFDQIEEHVTASLTLRVSRLEVLPEEEDARKALLSVMTWLKAYARTSFGQPVERSDPDKGDVFFAGRESDFFLEICILVLFLSLNLFLTLMAGIFLKSFSSFLVRKATGILKESTKMLSVYWGTGLVCTVANIVCFGADIYAFQTFLGLASRSHYKILYTKLFLIVFALITEPFIVYYTTRHFGSILNVPQKVVQALCCCFSNVYGSRFAHTLAVLNILWFVHRIATAMIIVLFHIVVTPAATFTTLTLILSVLLISVFLVAYILHTCSAPRVRSRVSLRTSCKVFCAFVTGVLAVGVVSSFALVYLMLLDNGLQLSGVGGFLLSLFPPFLFFTIGLIVQKKFLRKKTEEKDDKEDEIVSNGTGNIKKLAEYQQRQVDKDGGGVGRGKPRDTSPRTRALSLNTDHSGTQTRSHHNETATLL